MYYYYSQLGMGLVITWPEIWPDTRLFGQPNQSNFFENLRQLIVNFANPELPEVKKSWEILLICCIFLQILVIFDGFFLEI